MPVARRSETNNKKATPESILMSNLKYAYQSPVIISRGSSAPDLYFAVRPAESSNNSGLVRIRTP